VRLNQFPHTTTTKWTFQIPCKNVMYWELNFPEKIPFPIISQTYYPRQMASNMIYLLRNPKADNHGPLCSRPSKKSLIYWDAHLTRSILYHLWGSSVPLYLLKGCLSNSILWPVPTMTQLKLVEFSKQLLAMLKPWTLCWLTLTQLSGLNHLPLRLEAAQLQCRISPMLAEKLLASPLRWNLVTK